MRYSGIALFLALALLLGPPLAQAEKPQGAEAQPTLYCKVIKEPDPLLMGGWKCIFPLHLEKGELDTNPAEYWLIKFGDQYGLHFERRARHGRKHYLGWRDWTLNGKEITSDVGIRIFVENGEVYFKWKDDQAVKMTRIGQ